MGKGRSHQGIVKEITKSREQGEAMPLRFCRQQTVNQSGRIKSTSRLAWAGLADIESNLHRLLAGGEKALSYQASSLKWLETTPKLARITAPE